MTALTTRYCPTCNEEMGDRCYINPNARGLDWWCPECKEFRDAALFYRRDGKVAVWETLTKEQDRKQGRVIWKR